MVLSLLYTTVLVQVSYSQKSIGTAMSGKKAGKLVIEIEMYVDDHFCMLSFQYSTIVEHDRAGYLFMSD